MSDQFYPSDLFANHPKTNQESCNELASQITGTPVLPMKWQGANTYTVESIDSDQIVQFRSDNEPFDAKLTALAKAVHGNLAPATQYNGSLQGSQVSVWTMDKLPGVGFDYLIFSEDIERKVDTAVSDMARSVDARRSNTA
jgi:hypothetical protein